ncbi:hypothetical protein Acr_00g0016810 [Actinidia rufa]|uniref:Uncharacterized protein n=1 Tax=Actinidia rufa TaxID=165716 RepID=A0A7J0DB13_9ERIC|nr:hypothetical protein Acr_00g0016810 [Actinidia rufa]
MGSDCGILIINNRSYLLGIHILQAFAQNIVTGALTYSFIQLVGNEIGLTYGRLLHLLRSQICEVENRLRGPNKPTSQVVPLVDTELQHQTASETESERALTRRLKIDDLALPEVSQHSGFIREEGHIKKDCPKYKAQDQSSDTAATAVMADDDEIEGCRFDASGGILRVSKGNKEILWGKKTRGLYRLEGNVQTGGATVRHGSNGISKKNGQGKQPLHRVQDVHREAQRKETKSILRSCTAKGAATPKRVSFALDLISGGVLSNWHLGEKVQALRCGGAYTSVGSGVAR